MTQARPDFVIVGVSHGDGVLVLASTELTQAELCTELDAYESWGNPFAIRAERRRHTLTAEMRTFVTVYASDYPTAMRNLFVQWTPESARVRDKSLGTNTRALGHDG